MTGTHISARQPVQRAAAGTNSGGSSGGGSHSHGLGQIPDYQPVVRATTTSRSPSSKRPRPAATARSDSSPATHGLRRHPKRLPSGCIWSTRPQEPGPATPVATTDIRARSPTRTPSSASTLRHHQRHPGQVFAMAVAEKRASADMRIGGDDQDHPIEPPSTRYPRKNYCYTNSNSGALPTSIAESNLNYSAST